MSIIYRKGNLLNAFDEGEIDIIAHGVNCSGGFGSGIAGQIAKRFPEVKRQYLFKYNTKGWYLGQIQLVYLNNKIIVNCATQKYYGKYPESQLNGMYCSYEAIRECMHQLKTIIKDSDLRIGIPKIGAGLAGGDWNEIEKVINEEFNDIPIYVYVLEE